ncbi:MAG: TIGR00153 family protein [Acidobacteriota bacterium]|nr:MAG: TIGR00153 family protein [Acidobacteriota bacterium]
MLITNPIASLFRESPFGPLQEHMRVVIDCTKEVVPLFEALLKEDYDELEVVRKRIFEKEKAADKIKMDIRTHLPRGLFMPVDRRDLLDLLKGQDSIADRVQDAAVLIGFGHLKVPPSLKDRLLEFVQLNLDAALKCNEVMSNLTELLEMGFTGKVVERVNVMVTELSVIETATDDLGHLMVRTMVEHEIETSHTSFVLWYDLLRILGDIADSSENVGDRLRLMIAR